MVGRRSNTSDTLKDTVLFVMSKYRHEAMNVQKLSLLVSFENNGLSTSWKTVQKHIDQLVKERKVSQSRLPMNDKGVKEMGYQLKV